MRAFIGIPLPEAARNKLYRETRNLRSEYPDLKWVKPEAYHITMFFLGETGESDVEQLTSALRQVDISVGCYEARITGLGKFPHKGPPRVVYAPLDDGAEATTELHRKLAETIRPYMQKKNNKFTPHVTIARVKKRISRAFDDSLEHVKIDIAFPIESIVAFRSTLTPQGAIYDRLFERSFPANSAPTDQ